MGGTPLKSVIGASTAFMITPRPRLVLLFDACMCACVPPCLACWPELSNGAKVVSIAQTEKRGMRAVESRVLESSSERPEYNRAVKVVQAAGREAQREA